MTPFHYFLLICLTVCTLDFCKKIPVFYARKLTHMLCGILIMLFDTKINGYRNFKDVSSGDILQNNPSVNYIYTLSIISIARCFFYPFRFGSYYDKGIIIYNVIVSLFFFFKFPLYILTPMFFADPMAAIIGKSFPSTQIYKKKTLLGTLTTFIVSYFSLYYIKQTTHVIFMSILLCLLELFGGTVDNLLLCLPLFVYMIVYKV